MNRQKPGGKVLLPPINFIFKLLQQQTPVEIWLFQQDELRIQGKIRGFDEFMNMVLDDAIEVPQPTKKQPVPGPRRELGQILLKGDNVKLIAEQSPLPPGA